MLQKTTAKQVQSIIEEFFKKFPRINDLKKGNIQEIRDLITPLGIEHRRSKILKNLAKTLVEKHGGQVPNSKKELLALQGVGKYISNSVLYLAFGKPTPIVDTNIVRILERVFDLKSEKSRARSDSRIWDFVKQITPPSKSREVNLALLDFGSLVCTAKKPRHRTCPVSHICIAYSQGRV